MPIIQSDIKFYNSTNGLGGAISVNEIISATVHNLFDLVGSEGAASGETNYRCFYVKNENASDTYLNAAAFILSNTPLAESDIEIGLGTSIVGGVEQVIGNEDTAPLGVTFSAPTSFPTGLVIGDIPFGSHKAIWVKRIITAGAPATNADAVTIAVRGETNAAAS
jgi:hypothetical protein